MPAVEPPLREPPFAAEQHLTVIGLQLLLLQPCLQRRRQAERGFNQAAAGPLAQQPRTRRGGRTAEQGIEGIEQQRLAGSGLAGKHRETSAELQLQPLNQGDVLEAQSGEHAGPPVEQMYAGTVARVRFV